MKRIVIIDWFGSTASCLQGELQRLRLNMGRINDMVDQEIVAGGRRQHEQNLADEINGGHNRFQ